MYYYQLKFSIGIMKPFRILFKKNRLLFPLIAFLFSLNVLYAQTLIKITGTVFNEKGIALEGVTVAIKTTTTGTQTDAQGKFSLTAPNEQSILSISYLNMVKQEVKIGSTRNFNINLQSTEQAIDEVVVVGYGTQKKTSLTAAVSTLSGSEITRVPVANLSNAIGGRVPGVIFKQNSGEPGQDGASLLIRGTGTTGNASPLVIVDGVPRSFNQLDPNSVESFTFLKDAAAVAPYGVAGANGVILVTTKKGKVGRTNLSYNGYYGLQNPTMLPKMVNSFEYGTMRNAANANVGAAPVYTEEQLNKYRDGSDPDVFPNHDVLNELINKNSPIMGHNLSISGGSEKIRYFGALGYMSQDGMWGPTGFKRYNMTSNIELQATSTTKFALNLSGRIEEKKYPGKGASSIFDQLYRTPPTAPLLFSNGLPGSYIGRSAYGNIFQSGSSESQKQVLLSQITIDQQLPFLKGLSAKAVFSYDLNDVNGAGLSKTWLTPIPYYTVDTKTNPYTYPQAGTDGPAKPSYDMSYAQNQALTYQAFLNYLQTFGKHDVSATAVYEYRNGKFLNLAAGRRNYNVNIPEINNGSPVATDLSNSGSSSESKQNGFIFRGNYAYDSRYLFEVSGRMDGHYAFAPDKRYHFFPAASLGWRISNEKFMQGQTAWLDNLKLRASYGISGALPYIDGNLALFQYLSSYAAYTPSAVLEGVTTQGLYETVEANPDITWETAKKTNIGFELSIYKGLFSIEADYFTEDRNDMLTAPQVLLPSEYGIGVAQRNAGRMKNRGFDFSAISRFTIANDIKIQLAGNFTFAKNKLVEVFENEVTKINPNRSRTGRPLGTQFGYRSLGLFQASDDLDGDGIIQSSEYGVAQFGTLRPGDIKYEDLNGDNKITPDDEVEIGKPTTPIVIYGFSPSISYKNIDLNMLFQGATGRNFYINGQAAYPFFNSGSALKSTMDYWTPENTDAHYPRLTPTPTDNNSRTSSFWMRSGSYLRLKSIELGYTLPSTWIKNIQSVRVYASGQNLLTWSKEIKDFDPEISESNGNYYPQQSVVSFGLNVNF